MAKVQGGDRLIKYFSRHKINPASVRVGFLENARYPDGTLVAMVAAIQDGGAPNRNIPPRPFFRNMIAAKKGEWPDAIANLLKANHYDAVKTMKLTGSAVAGQLRESIANFSGVPLKPSTIARKGGVDKQLVDTGHLLNSVDFEVKTK